MRNMFTRAAAAAAVLIVALPVAASADVTEYAAEASTTAVELSVFENQVGNPLLELVGTEAFGDSTPTASGAVSAMTVVGTQVGTVRSAESDRDRVRDPESGDGCALPVATTGLTLDVLCAVATARAGNPGDTGNQDASGTTTLTDISVNGSFVSAALTTPLDAFIRASLMTSPTARSRRPSPPSPPSATPCCPPCWTP